MGIYYTILYVMSVGGAIGAGKIAVHWLGPPALRSM